MSKTGEDLFASLAEYSSCDIGDALIKIGYEHGGYIPDLELYSPAEKSNVKVIGEAFTVKMVSTSEGKDNKPQQHFIDAAEEGSVLVVSAPPYTKNAVWGGLMTAGAKAKKIKGVIVDGRCRDLAEHRQAKFPVFARGHSILGQANFTRPGEINQPITIGAHPSTVDSYNNLFPSVTVRARDIIVADEDGVVVIKPEHVEQVLEACKHNKEVEAKCFADLEKGRSVEDTFKEHRGGSSVNVQEKEEKTEKK